MEIEASSLLLEVHELTQYNCSRVVCEQFWLGRCDWDMATRLPNLPLILQHYDWWGARELLVSLLIAEEKEQVQKEHKIIYSDIFWYICTMFQEEPKWIFCFTNFKPVENKIGNTEIPPSEDEIVSGLPYIVNQYSVWSYNNYYGRLFCIKKQPFSFVRNYFKLKGTLLDFLLTALGGLNGKMVGRGNGYRKKSILGREYTKHKLPNLPDLPKPNLQIGVLWVRGQGTPFPSMSWFHKSSNWYLLLWTIGNCHIYRLKWPNIAIKNNSNNIKNLNNEGIEVYSFVLGLAKNYNCFYCLPRANFSFGSGSENEEGRGCFNVLI